MKAFRSLTLLLVFMMAFCMMNVYAEEIQSAVPTPEVIAPDVVEPVPEAITADPPVQPARSSGVDATLDGTPLSGYTYSLASLKFSQDLQKFKRDFQVKILIGSQEYILRAEDIACDGDTIKLLQDIWLKGTEPGRAYQTSYTYDTAKLDAFIQKMIGEAHIVSNPTSTVDVSKFEAEFNTETRQYSWRNVDNHVIGYTMDTAAFYKQVHSAVSDAMKNTDGHKAGVTASVQPLTNVPTPESQGWGVITKYTTKTTNVSNRNTNIRIASGKVSGTEVKPGGIFSYNTVLGPTRAADGYKEATVFVSGTKSTGIGGGICQISSTIYNTVLDAGLKVVERHPHSLPVTYVPKGRDATVSYPNVDFRFQNTTTHSLYVMVSFEGNTLTASLYGKK